MTDRPILYSAAMVRALLAGTKIQTRRILKPQPYSNGFHFDGHDILCHIDDLPPSAMLMDRGKGKNRYTISNMEDGPEGMSGVYVGDRLWVREAWRTFVSLDAVPPRDLLQPGRGAGILYEADDGGLAITAAGERSMGERDDRRAFGKLRPGLFMPRWASRLTQVVTDVRVQRLQDISEEDAIAEGVGCVEIGSGYRARYTVLANSWADVVEQNVVSWTDARDAYAALWDEINGPGSWDANPWVAAYTVETHRCNIDAMPGGEGSQ